MILDALAVLLFLILIFLGPFGVIAIWAIGILFCALALAAFVALFGFVTMGAFPHGR